MWSRDFPGGAVVKHPPATRKMAQMNRFAGQKLRHRSREQTYRHQGGKAAGVGGGGVMNWVIGIYMYTLMCIKLMTNKDLLYKKNKLNKIQNLKKKENGLPLLIFFFKASNIFF